MQLNRCPICHTRIGLDALAQDEAGRELLGMLSRLTLEMGTALIGYLSLFRSKTRDLANDRALKLAHEVLNLGTEAALAQAMQQTVEQMRAKGGAPLSNHNYLRKVLGDCHGFKTDISLKPEPQQAAKPTSKTAQALQALEDFGND